jgi:cytochrome c oxidase subunit 2
MVGQATRVRLTPERAGRFPFHCDVYCGPGHDSMTGVLEVIE